MSDIVIFKDAPYFDVIGNAFSYLKENYKKVKQPVLVNTYKKLGEIKAKFDERWSCAEELANYLAQNEMDCFNPTDKHAKKLMQKFDAYTVELHRLINSSFGNNESVASFFKCSVAEPKEMEPTLNYISLTLLMRNRVLNETERKGAFVRLSEYMIEQTIPRFVESIPSIPDISVRRALIRGVYRNYVNYPHLALCRAGYEDVKPEYDLGTEDPIGNLASSLRDPSVLQGENRDTIIKYMIHRGSIKYTRGVSVKYQTPEADQYISAQYLLTMSPYIDSAQRQFIRDCTPDHFGYEQFRRYMPAKRIRDAAISEEGKVPINNDITEFKKD